MFKMKTGSGGGNVTKAPAGNHVAVLIGIIDLGTQQQEYQGETKWQRKAFFAWELVDEIVAGTHNERHVIGIDLTLSLTEKSKLRKWIEARRGKVMPDGAEFDLADELGQPCLLNVVEKNGYPKIEGVGPVPKGLKHQPAQRKPFTFALESPASAESLELPTWMPYLYGRPLTEWIGEARECGNHAAPKPVTKPTASKRPATLPGSTIYWLEYPEGSAPREMTRDQIEEELSTVLGEEQVAWVCKKGTTEWTSHIDAGMKTEPIF